VKQNLKKYLRVMFTDVEANLICRQFELVKLNTGDVFIAPGTIVDMVGFIDEGILRVVEHGKEKERIIHYFYGEKQFCSESNGYYRRGLSKFSVEVATPCEILTISFEKMEQLANKIPTFEQMRTKVSEQSLVNIAMAQEIPKRRNAQERYEEFLKQYPSISGRLKVYDIASYLGITPNHLSTIRKTF